MEATSDYVLNSISESGDLNELRSSSVPASRVRRVSSSSFRPSRPSPLRRVTSSTSDRGLLLVDSYVYDDIEESVFGSSLNGAISSSRRSMAPRPANRKAASQSLPAVAIKNLRTLSENSRSKLPRPQNKKLSRGSTQVLLPIPNRPSDNDADIKQDTKCSPSKRMLVRSSSRVDIMVAHSTIRRDNVVGDEISAAVPKLMQNRSRDCLDFMEGSSKIAKNPQHSVRNASFTAAFSLEKSRRLCRTSSRVDIMVRVEMPELRHCPVTLEDFSESESESEEDADL